MNRHLTLGALCVILLGACGESGKASTFAVVSGPTSSITIAATTTTILPTTTTIVPTTTTLPACIDPSPAVSTAKQTTVDEQTAETNRYLQAVSKKTALALVARSSTLQDGAAAVREVDAAVAEGMAALAEFHKQKIAEIDARLATRLQSILAELEIERTAGKCR